jgi:hypothetical protein
MNYLLAHFPYFEGKMKIDVFNLHVLMFDCVNQLPALLTSEWLNQSL